MSDETIEEVKDDQYLDFDPESTEGDPITDDGEPHDLGESIGDLPE